MLVQFIHELLALRTVSKELAQAVHVAEGSLHEFELLPYLRRKQGSEELRQSTKETGQIEEEGGARVEILSEGSAAPPEPAPPALAPAAVGESVGRD